jgi:hypothetical protein
MYFVVTLVYKDGEEEKEEYMRWDTVMESIGSLKDKLYEPPVDRIVIGVKYGLPDDPRL